MLPEISRRRLLRRVWATSERSREQVLEDLRVKRLHLTAFQLLHCRGLQYEALPAFLKRTKYKTPADELHTVFQAFWKTPLHAF
jgi:hypothetical protein